MTQQDFALKFLSLNLVLAIACSGAPQDAAPVEPAAPTPAAVEPSAPTTPVAEPAAAPAAEPEKSAEPAAVAPPKPTPQPTAAKPAAREPAAEEPAAATKPEPQKPAQGIAVGEPTGKPCGEDGQPMCPLEAFMERQVDAAMESGDLDKLAAALKRVSDLVPDPSWNSGAQGWAAISNAGAAAAASGNLEGARASCKGCHRAWRKKYKESYRARPL